MKAALVGLVATGLACAAGAHAASSPWAGHTASTLTPRRLEVGVFRPLRYGLSDSLELATHPLLAALMPNVALKIGLGDHGNWQLATRHNLTYPTGLLQAVARRGTLGVLPQNARVPHIVGLTNEALATWSNGPHLVTYKVGLLTALRVGEMDMPSIDLPLLFARTAAYRRGWSAHAGVDYVVRVHARLQVHADVDAFLLSTPQGRYAVEQAALLIWEVREHARLSAGYKLTYGAYPFGNEWNLGNSWVPLPLVDFELAFD